MVSVAIDGPAGAGKSTLARRLAAEMGYIYVDTGAMFRTIGLYALRKGVDPKDNAAVNTLLPEIGLRVDCIDGEQHIYLNGEDVSSAIRTEEAGMAASAVGANPEVRAFLLELQRGMTKTQNVLMDGRDIGTVVLPDATVKIFLTAAPEARARRRCRSASGASWYTAAISRSSISRSGSLPGPSNSGGNFCGTPRTASALRWKT